MTKTIEELKSRLLKFRDERDWQQFHSFKNLACSVAIETGELLELTQWKSDAQLEHDLTTKSFRELAAKEIADVFAYLLLLCEKLDIDLIEATDAKIQENETRYPVNKSKGSARKYTEL